MTELIFSSQDKTRECYKIPLSKENEKMIFNSPFFQAKYNEAVFILMNRKNYSKELNRNEVLAFTQWVNNKENDGIRIVPSIRKK